VIKKNSSLRWLVRFVAIIAILYLSINLNENQEIFGVLIGLILLYLLILDQSYTISTDGDKIYISLANILRLFVQYETIKYSEIATIEFKPAKFSTTLFILNGIFRSGSRSYQKSILKINKKNGEIIELKNIGTEEDINYLQRWL
jgi:hypothetical protein